MMALLAVACSASAQEWKKDLNQALAEADAEHKYVLLLFSVPDACDICGQLESKVMASEEFKAYAKANFVLAKPDFSGSASYQTKADNLLIVEKYNKDGFFPWVVILDRNSKVLGRTGNYNNETPEEYIKILQAIIKDK